MRKQDSDRLSFLGHLDELRVRATRCMAVFFLGFMLCYFLANQWILEFLRAPLFEILPPDQQKLYFTSLFENFLTHLKIAAVSSLFLFAPYYFYELWAFIAPGLYPKERRYAVPFIVASTVFFVGGAAFAYYILFPVAFEFFLHFGLQEDTPILTINAYYTTCLKLFVLFGMAFELPVIVSFLGFLGVIDAKKLRENRRTAIMGITIGCAMFAPPDAISMIILMAPLILLYELAILFVSWIGKRRNEEEEISSEIVDRRS